MKRTTEEGNIGNDMKLKQFLQCSLSERREEEKLKPFREGFERAIRRKESCDDIGTFNVCLVVRVLGRVEQKIKSRRQS